MIPGIMEHIERAGIHSGDSISVYPAQSISDKAKETIEEYTRRLARSLHVVGMINIPVYRVRGRSVCDRSESAFQPYGTVYQQGDGHPDRTAGHEGDPGT